MGSPNTALFPAGLGVPDIDGANPSRLDPNGRFFEPREGVLRILGAWDIFRVTRAPFSPSPTPQRGDIHIQTPATFTGADPATTDPDAVFFNGSAWVPLAADAFWCAVVKRVLGCVLSSNAGNTAVIGTDGGLYVPTPAVDINVQNLSYNAATKAIVLTETDGTVHSISVADLVDVETVTTLTADAATSSLTYTNEAGAVVAVRRVSSAPNNLVGIGPDGGAFISRASAWTIV